MQDFHLYYKLLEISPEATADEVKEAYRRLARQFHPDLNPGDQAAEEKFKAISEAYQVLSGMFEQAQTDPAVASPRSAADASSIDFCDRGLKKARRGNYAAAINDYNRAVQIDPNNVWAYCQRGLAYYKLTAYKEAFGDYAQALELNPRFAEAYYNRGTARRKLGSAQGALQDFDQAIQLNPSNAQAYKKRGLTRSDLGNRRGAISDLQQAVKLFSDQGNPARFQSALDLLRKLQRQRVAALRKTVGLGLLLIGLCGLVLLLIS